jgi:Asp/Glu/hydantoin racemase
MNRAPSHPLIAVISAVTTAVEPARSAIDSALPGAQIWNLVDDRLMTDARAAGGVTPRLAARMNRLIDHALAEDAAAVLVTCSLYSDTVRTRGAGSVPVLAPDDAAFDAVLSAGWHKVLLITPLDEALLDSRTRLARHATAAHHPLEIRGAVASNLPEGPSRTPVALARSLGEVITSAGTDVDGILLGQYSLSPAAEALATDLGIPVLSTPGCAADRLAHQLATSGVLQ